MMKRANGFTLIQLVIVLVIFGIFFAGVSGFFEKKKSEQKEKCVEGKVYQKLNSGVWIETELKCLVE